MEKTREELHKELIKIQEKLAIIDYETAVNEAKK